MFIAPRIAEKRDWLKGDSGDWEIIIGLEIHAQVASTSKLFSGSSTEYGAEPNSQVSLVDAGMPGMLPVVNEFCVEQAVKTGLGLNSKINLFSRFDRKNYFYVDLPQGYQISQFEHPIVGEGEIEVLPIDADGNTMEPVTVGIERLHLEQDAGKSVHDLSPDETYVDLNRCGVALMEIVSKPDMRSPEEASAYVDKIRGIVRALGTCDGDMEKGNLRADVNVSVRKPGGELGTRCEIRTSTLCALSVRLLIMKPAAISRLSKRAVRLTKRHVSLIASKAKHARCVPKKTRMITAISPTLICSRLSLSKALLTALNLNCQKCPTRLRRAL